MSATTSDAPLKPPILRLFKPRGLGYVFVHGRRIYLGHFDSAECKRAYRDLLISWGFPPPGPFGSPGNEPIVIVESIAQLARAFKGWAPQYYQKHGRVTKSADNVVRTVQLLAEHGLDQLAIAEVSPWWLRQVQAALLTDPAGLSRSTINEYVNIVRRMLSFGVVHGFVGVATADALKHVPPLKKGRPPLPGSPVPREGTPVEEVPREWIRIIRRYLTPEVRVMLDVQLVTGARPSEICAMRPIHIRPSKLPGVQIYTVPAARNKTDHVEGHRPREIYLGPRAQKLLRLVRPKSPTDPYFQPSRSRAQADARRSQRRTLPAWPSHDPEFRRQRRRAAGVKRARMNETFSADSYRKAIERACEAAAFDQRLRGVPEYQRVQAFAPNRIRHTAATDIATREDLHVASFILGHASVRTTQRYAKVREKTAARAAARAG